MNRFHVALAASVSLLPFTALAQNVPAIQNGGASASASASAQAGSVPTIAGGQGGSTQQAKPPPGWPPITATLSVPAVSLDSKEKAAVNLSAKWRDKKDRPLMDNDGVLRWMYGNSQTRVVCSPLNISDIELKPGETVNNIRLGDTGFWNVTLAISGSPEGRVTHLAITPRESGREASMLVYTDQRTYAVKLVSTAQSYTAKTGFTYADTSSDSMQNTLAAYHAAVGSSGGSSESGTSVMAHIELLKIDGDSPSWRPQAAYTDGKKTYIQFPKDIQFGEAPALLGVNADGGWFTAPSERRVIYRWMGNRIIADTVMDKIELIFGVGGSQSKVILTRQK